jgi:hypothetical protein
MLFKPRTVDEACVQEKYLENRGQKKGQSSEERAPRIFQGEEEEVERRQR